MVTQKGRPDNAEGRLLKEIKIYDILDKLSIEYLRADHAPCETMEDCKAVSLALNAHVCKNLFLCNRQKTCFYLLMIPEDKPFKTKDISAQIGSARLSFAGPEFMEEFLDITPGSVSVLGLSNDLENKVSLLIDEDILKEEYFGAHPCINTSTLKIKVSDLIEKFLPEVKHGYTKVVL